VRFPSASWRSREGFSRHVNLGVIMGGDLDIYLRNKAVYLIDISTKGTIMPAIKKQVNESQYGGAIIDGNIKSHANDPFVLKKIEKAKQMVSKFGLPPDKKK